MEKLLVLKEIGEWVFFYFTLFKLSSFYIFFLLILPPIQCFTFLFHFPYHSQQCLLSCPSYEFLFVRSILLPRYMWTAVWKTKLFSVSLYFPKELIWCLKAALCTANTSWSYWKFKDWNKNINVFIKTSFITIKNCLNGFEMLCDLKANF